MVPDTSVHDNSIPLPDPAARQRFRAVLAEVAAQATQALPAAVNGRVERACQLLLAADVVLRSDGSAEVGSRSSVETMYVVTSGGCPCSDAKRADIEGWCAHRIARALLISVHRRLAEAEPEPTASEPAPAPPGIPAQLLVTLHNKVRSIYRGLEGVAELWICYPMRAQEKNGSPQEGETYDYSSPALPTLPRHRYRAPWENTARQTTLSLPRERMPRQYLSAGVFLSRSISTHQSAHSIAFRGNALSSAQLS